MRRRPLACLMLLLFLILQLIPADRMIRSAGIVEKCKGQVTGTVTYRQHQKENMQLTLADCQIESGGSVQHADQLLVTLTDDTEYPVGSVLSLSGTDLSNQEKKEIRGSLRKTVLWCKKNRRNRLWGKCPYPDGSPIAGERVTSPTKKEAFRCL